MKIRVTEGGDITFIHKWVITYIKCIFVVHGVYTIRGSGIGCSCRLMLIDVQQIIFSRNAKLWPSIVVSVKNKI
jgi:hypothetical protein